MARILSEAPLHDLVPFRQNHRVQNINQKGYTASTHYVKPHQARLANTNTVARK